LVTRQIFAGAGKLGSEAESAAGEPGVYQISQRADFFSVLVSIDTMNRRPLVNTRDEPHANAAKYRRFHVIIGDANMSEWATALKMGTTALALDLIERGTAPPLEIADPIRAVKSVSRDQDYHWLVELRDGRTIPAIDLQRQYLAAAQKLDHARDTETAWILAEWETVLNDLERDVAATQDRVDWVAKKFLLTALREEERLEWSDPWLQAIDLEYHNIDPEAGLFQALERQGTMRRIVADGDIAAARLFPPETTRAFFRGRSVAKYGSAVASVQWDEVVFTNDGRPRRIALPEVFDDPRLERLNALCREDLAAAEFIEKAARA
ncbi:MAG: proteasome accessory factor PafA2 family protein, partial [Verrucomicrobiota bacterium]|nr:proteasome accessory factor PafA2 family protein [Verrucomicrobiota bacterium]